MKKNVRLILIATAAGVVVALCLIVWLNRSDDKRPGESHQSIATGKTTPPPEPAPTTPVKTADAPSSPTASKALEAQANEAIDIMMKKLPRSTAVDLVEKGFPPMSNPRSMAYNDTKDQSLPELVADLGDQMILAYCRPSFSVSINHAEIYWYRHVISRYIKVLRLIEEGRKKPKYVAELLEKELEPLVDEEAHKEAWRKWLNAVRTHNLGGTGDNDAYYAKHHRYESPIIELGRMHHVAYMSFYVLANIDRSAPRLLARWIKIEKDYRYRCTDMDVWLIDCHYRQAKNNPPGAATHAQLTDGVELSGQKNLQSRWKAGWDRNDFLLKAKNVNVQDIETIETLRIPQKLPEALDAETKQKIIKNFLAAYGR